MNVRCKERKTKEWVRELVGVTEEEVILNKEKM